MTEDLARRRVQARAFLFIDAAVPVRAWTGVGGYRLPPDAVDTEGGRYLGVGWMRDWPVLESLLNGAADSVTFTLSGVDARTLALVDAAAGDVEGRRAWLGVQFCGPRYARRPVRWIKALRVDQAGAREAGLQGAGPQGSGGVAVESAVTLTLGSAHTSRRRAQPVYWDHASRQRLFSGDMGMALVGRYGPGATRAWPPKA